MEEGFGVMNASGKASLDAGLVVLRHLKVRAHCCLFYVLYFICLTVVYTTSAFTQLWGYQHFSLEFDELRFAMNMVVLGSLASVMPVRLKPSMMICHMAMAFVLVPAFVLHACAGHSLRYLVITIMGYCVIYYISVFSPRPYLEMVYSARPSAVMYVCCAALSVVLLITVGAGGLENFNLDISAVYDYRDNVDQLLPGFLHYLTSWANNVFLPIAVILGLVKKSPSVLILSIVMGVFLFSMMAEKSALFMPIVCMGVYWVFRSYVRDPVKAIRVCAGMLFCLLAASWLDFYLLDNGDGGLFWVGSLGFRRTIMVPAALNSLYMDFYGNEAAHHFFSHNMDKFGLSGNGVMAGPSTIIGEHYFGPGAGANTGWVGTGYAQVGLAGVVLYSVFVGLLGVVCDGLTRHLGVVAATSVAFFMAETCIRSSDFLTSMVTHGGFLMLAIAFSVRPAPYGELCFRPQLPSVGRSRTVRSPSPLMSPSGVSAVPPKNLC